MEIIKSLARGIDAAIRNNLALRLYASAIDFTVFAVLFLLLWHFFATTKTFVDDLQQIINVLLIVAIVAMLYFFLSLALFGRTLGKLAVGLKVVRCDGSPLSFRDSAVRALFSHGIFAAILASSFWAPPPTLFRPLCLLLYLLVDYAVMFADSGGRSLHDVIAGTMAVRAKPH